MGLQLIIVVAAIHVLSIVSIVVHDRIRKHFDERDEPDHLDITVRWDHAMLLGVERARVHEPQHRCWRRR